MPPYITRLPRFNIHKTTTHEHIRATVYHAPHLISNATIDLPSLHLRSRISHHRQIHFLLIKTLSTSLPSTNHMVCRVSMEAVTQ